MSSLTFSGGDVLTIIGYLTALAGSLAAMVRWVIGRIEILRKEHDLEIAAANRNTDDSRHKLANEITAIRAEYLRREDFNQHMARLEKGVDGVSDDLKRLGARMDRMLAMMATGRRPRERIEEET